MKRKQIVAGNWKMNKNLQEGIELSQKITNLVKDKDNNAEVVLCPPFIHLSDVSQVVANTNVSLGAQNCAHEASGAFTGEVSAEMIASTGAQYVIIGHSERRIIYNETDETLNQKVKLALENNLIPIFCIGEQLDEREKGIQENVVSDQLKNGVFDLAETDFNKIILAYEPVWAIGTGKTATPDQAQEMHKFVRDQIRNTYGNEIAEETSILYGGSCKPSNANELFSKTDVDGGLIGGASLKADDFTGIINAAE